MLSSPAGGQSLQPEGLTPRRNPLLYLPPAGGLREGTACIMKTQLFVKHQTWVISCGLARCFKQAERGSRTMGKNEESSRAQRRGSCTSLAQVLLESDTSQVIVSCGHLRRPSAPGGGCIHPGHPTITL